MKFENLLIKTENNITTISINRPKKLNALNIKTFEEIANAVKLNVLNEKTKCIIITGVGDKAFIAGADIKEFIDYNASDAYDFSQNGNKFLFEVIENSTKPIIAMINGACAGIGLIFTLYADLRFTTNEAKFTTAFASRGLIAEHGIAWLLPRLIGEAKALDLLLSARIFKGAEAESLGLVNKSLPTEELENFVNNYAKHMAERVSPRSMTIMKRQIRAGYSQTFSKSLEIADKEMFLSFDQDDFKEGVESFVENRAPQFRGVGK